MTLVHLSLGGPNRTIQVHGKRHHFEMHPYCGPVAIGKNGEPLKNQSRSFLKAASLWTQQGQRMDDDGLCVWDHPAREEPILKHLGGNRYLAIGFTQIPARKGE